MKPDLRFTVLMDAMAGYLSCLEPPDKQVLTGVMMTSHQMRDAGDTPTRCSPMFDGDYGREKSQPAEVSIDPPLMAPQNLVRSGSVGEASYTFLDGKYRTRLDGL